MHFLTIEWGESENSVTIYPVLLPDVIGCNMHALQTAVESTLYLQVSQSNVSSALIMKCLDMMLPLQAVCAFVDHSSFNIICGSTPAAHVPLF